MSSPAQKSISLSLKVQQGLLNLLSAQMQYSMTTGQTPSDEKDYVI